MIDGLSMSHATSSEAVLENELKALSQSNLMDVWKCRMQVGSSAECSRLLPRKSRTLTGACRLLTKQQHMPVRLNDTMGCLTAR